MDNFKIIYKILKRLEASMDFAEMDTAFISAETLGISPERWAEIIKMLAENGYIIGVSIKTYVHMKEPAIMGIQDIKITLKGLEYLQENSMMKKVAEAAAGIVGIIK